MGAIEDHPDEAVLDSEYRFGSEVLCPVAGFLDDPEQSESGDVIRPTEKDVTPRMEKDLICDGTNMIVIIF